MRYTSWVSHLRFHEGHWRNLSVIYTYKKCKDKEAYIAKTAPALFVFGLVSVIYGVIDVIHCYVHTMTIVDTVAMIIFLIVLIWFGVYTRNLRNRYY